MRRPALAALLLGTACFGIALALRHSVNPWYSNAAAALISVVLSLALVRGQRRLPSVPWRGTLVAIALGVGLVLLTHLGHRAVLELMPSLGETIQSLYTEVGSTAPSRPLAAALILLVVLGEEILWRGVAFELLEKHSALVIVAGTTALYAVPQLIGGSMVLLCAALVLGGVLAVQRVLTRDLSGPVITHAIWSCSIFSLFPLVS